MQNNNELDEKIMDLEIRMAHLERTLETYDELIISQQKDINALKAKSDELLSFAASAQSSIIKSQSEETPPPHY